jgi:hypothetical protein
MGIEGVGLCNGWNAKLQAGLLARLSAFCTSASVPHGDISNLESNSYIVLDVL